MKFAVIEASGSQIKVREGETIEVNNLGLDKGEKTVFEKVLLYADDGKTVIGEPLIVNCKVTGKILDNIKGEKVCILIYKAKSRYRKRKGYRAKLTKVLIERINYGKD